jgi:hypothetical protein
LFEKQAPNTTNIMAEGTEATEIRDRYEAGVLSRFTTDNTDPSFANGYYFLSLT